MDADSWSRLSAASKRHQSTLQSRFDLYLGSENVDGGEDDSRAEFACPFCAEDFDIVGLCCHIEEEHPVEAKNGVCPVCAARVGMDMVSHITKQHGNFFKMQCRRRFLKGSSGSHSTLSLLRKELREGNLQSLFGGSSYTIAPSNAAADPLLSSFITNLPVADPSKEEKPETLDDRNVVNEVSELKAVESFCWNICLRDYALDFSISKGVMELLNSIDHLVSKPTGPVLQGPEGESLEE